MLVVNLVWAIVTHVVGWLVVKLLERGLSKERFRKPPVGLWYYNPVYYGPPPSEETKEKRLGEARARLKNAVARAHNVKILSSTGWTTYASKDVGFLHDTLEAKSAGTLQFLLLHPECQNIIQERSEVSGLKPPSKYVQQIKDTTDWVLEFKQRHVGMNIDIKYYQQYPVWRVFICDDREVYVQPYLAEMLGDFAPIVGFRASEDLTKYSMAKIFVQMFDRMFQHGTPPEKP